MKINWNIVKGLALLVSVMFLVGFSHHKNNEKKVREITIEFEDGNSLFMNYDMVDKLLKQNGNTVVNEPKTVINLHKLEANVLSHPMVEDASVFLTIDGALKTVIKQRTPIARIVSKTGSYYIDKHAEKMPLSINYSARVILISGNINEEDHAQIYTLVSKILEDEFLKKQIIGVRKVKNNEFVLSTRIGNQKIELGKIEDLNKKFKNLNSFFNKTMADETIKNYSVINLKYNNQVVCSKN